MVMEHAGPAATGISILLAGAMALGCGGPQPRRIGAAASGPPADPAPSGTTGDEGDDDVVHSDVPPPPIAGGTLHMLADGQTVVVSDMDRDLVHLVDIAALEATASIELPAGAHPWRIAEDEAGQVHVVLRGTGRVITVDPSSGEIVADREACPHARGIAVRPDDQAILVACASGELVALGDEGQPPRLLATLDADLRDVIARDDGSIDVSRFQSAEMLRLAAANLSPLPTVGLDSWINSTPPKDDIDDLVPGTAWRTIGLPEGGWLMVHQVASNRTLGTNSLGTYYGGSGCRAVVQSGVTRFSASGAATSTGPMADVILPVDLAVSPDGAWAAVAVAGGCDGCPNPDAVLVSLDDDLHDSTAPPCENPIPIHVDPDAATIVAVAFAPSGHLFLQSREPSRLYRVDVDDPGTAAFVDLSAVSMLDTGHALFHANPGSGITCASCHPEGGDDGHVWRFKKLGLRHTPSLYVGIEGTAPFHWGGELADMHALVQDVFVGRMGAEAPSAGAEQALEAWIFTLSPPTVSTGTEAEHGAEVFADLECDSCHVGDALTDDRSVAIGFDASLQVPPLRGVVLHPPYMHDARSATLDDATRDMIGRTRPDATVSDDDVAALVAFLRSR